MGRLRSIKNASSLITKYKNLIKKKKKVVCSYIEIGCGKGQFSIMLAQKYPKTKILAIERNATVMLKALRKYESIEKKTNNLFFANIDANELPYYIKPNSIEKIYINFPDPWPKKRHIKFRLVNETFLALYYQLLTEQGTIEFKTDNKDLYDYALEVLKETKQFKIIAKTTDLHKNKQMLVDNIMTEYETKFVALKKKINKLILSK